jgi:hypothetical protein
MTPPGAMYDTAPNPAFLALAVVWTRDQADLLLGFVWAGYDRMRANMPVIDTRDLERAITQRLEARINDVMTGDEPFYVQHSPFEHETMARPPAQPPANDFAFVWREEERIMWPLEAKVLTTPGTLVDYEAGIRNNYLSCRYAPFSSGGAMLGYLLSGAAVDALTGIETRLGCPLDPVPAFAARPHRVSKHQRIVPSGKNYPADFHCYHLILEYMSLTRHRG